MGLGRTGYVHGLVISNAQKTLVLQFGSSILCQRWEEAIRSASEAINATAAVKSVSAVPCINRWAWADITEMGVRNS